MDPTLDETQAGLLAAKRVFPRCQRAHHAQERLAHDERDRRQVEVAKPRIERERLVEREPDPGGHEATDHEEDERRVDEEDRVGERRAQSADTAAGATLAAIFASRAGAFSLGYG